MSAQVGPEAVPKVDSPAGKPVTRGIRSRKESGVKNQTNDLSSISRHIPPRRPKLIHPMRDQSQTQTGRTNGQKPSLLIFVNRHDLEKD